MSGFSLELPRALALQRLPAVFRERPEDFVVEEILGFELTGEGEHLWLWVEKQQLNTVDVQKRLSSVTGVKLRDIAYCGLKDKQAITRQWFSLPYPAELPGDSLGDEGIRILKQRRNRRKLRPGSHKANRFTITLRGIAGGEALLESWLAGLKTRGVPNYFGPQRFGYSGRNLEKALALFDPGGKGGRITRHQRGLYLSAARAYLFNQVLAARVNQEVWDKCQSGDVMALAGTSSVFGVDSCDATLTARLKEGDIHPTGPLWGKGSSLVTGSVQELEEVTVLEFPELKEGLENAGLQAARRPLRIIPENVSLSTEEDKLVVEFTLPSGAFATSVLREMVEAPGL